MDIEALHARREERRRTIRRRRRVLVGVLVVLAAAIAATIVLANSGSGPAGSGRRLASTRGPRARPSAPSGHGAATSANTAAASTGPPGTEPVPILIYHVIAAAPAGAPFPGLYVEPAEFAEQMHALERAGWHAVTLDEVQAYWRHGVPLGAGKPVVVSCRSCASSAGWAMRTSS
jgi:hypothetical protein